LYSTYIGRMEKLNVSNLTVNTISIPPKAIVCELQPVTVDHENMDTIKKELEKDNMLGQTHVDTENNLYLIRK